MEITLCQHRFVDGKVCKNFALRGETFCRYHLRYKDQHDIASPDYRMPDLEDPESVQVFLNEAIRGVLSGKLDPRQGKTAIWGALVASSNLRQISRRNELAAKAKPCTAAGTEELNVFRDSVIATGPHAGRTIGEILDAIPAQPQPAVEVQS